MKTDIYNTFLGKAYRFLGFDGFIKTIESKTLWFSRIDTFNDPLDCNPLLHPYVYYVCERYQKAIKMFNPIKDKDLYEAIKTSFQSYYEKAYVCCFCKEYDAYESYLMWAYYGSHKQMCFEIDFNKNRLLGGPSNISYEEDLVRKRNLVRSNNPDERGLFIATTKSKIWEHEKEVRLIVDIESNNISKDITFSNDKKYLFYPFDIKIISKVIFAVNSDIKDEERVFKLMDSKSHKPIYEKMVINPDTLKLQSIDYDTFIS